MYFCPQPPAVIPIDYNRTSRSVGISIADSFRSLNTHMCSRRPHDWLLIVYLGNKTACRIAWRRPVNQAIILVSPSVRSPAGILIGTLPGLSAKIDPSPVPDGKPCPVKDRRICQSASAHSPTPDLPALRLDQRVFHIPDIYSGHPCDNKLSRRPIRNYYL